MYIEEENAAYVLRQIQREKVRRATSQNTQNDQNTTQNAAGFQTWGVVVVVLAGMVVLLIAILFSYSRLRQMRLKHKVPKFIPGGYLKRRWMAWKPRGKYASLEGQDQTSISERNEPTAQTTTRVDRHTSVRSIISLPAYSRAPKETEEVIGREGERAGMDTVVEFPETNEEEEDRREEEMESLYQIRQTRRQEIAEREERRRQRREAREAGDYARLEELRIESRQRREQNNSSTNLTAEMLIAEHNARGRDRRVSSVSYGQLGQVRHDGSRVRAGSMESERALLSGAAPMGGDIPPVPHSRHGSEATSFLSMNDIPRLGHNRDRSNSGAMSISSAGSSFDNISRPNTRPGTARASNVSHRGAQSISSNTSDEIDLGEERLEPLPVEGGSSPLPPTYDAHDWGNAPAYEEEQRIARMNSRASQLQRASIADTNSQNTSHNVPRAPGLQVTPIISIQGPSMPNSPAVGRNEGPNISANVASS